MWSVKCEVWGLECEGSSGKWEVRSVKCGVWSFKFGVRKVQCEVWSVKTLLRLSLKKSNGCRGKDTVGTGCLWTIGHLCLGNFRRRLARVYVINYDVFLQTAIHFAVLEIAPADGVCSTFCFTPPLFLRHTTSLSLVSSTISIFLATTGYHHFYHFWLDYAPRLLVFYGFFPHWLHQKAMVSPVMVKSPTLPSFVPPDLLRWGLPVSSPGDMSRLKGHFFLKDDTTRWKDRVQWFTTVSKDWISLFCIFLVIEIRNNGWKFWMNCGNLIMGSQPCQNQKLPTQE